MNDIQVTYDPALIDEIRVGRRLLHRFHTPWRQALLGLAAMLAAVLVSMGLAAAVGGVTVSAAGILGIYSAGATIAVLFVGRYLFMLSLRRALLKYPNRHTPRRILLSDAGVRLNDITRGWDQIVAVSTMPGLTLLLISPVDAYILSDVNLPDGLTPERLRATVQSWRCAAGAFT